MKTKKNVTRKQVMSDVRSTKGTPCQVIKQLYSYRGAETKALNKILPANVNDLCAISGKIYAELHVGEVLRDKEGNAKLNAKGEERVQKFTQAALIGWLLKNQKTLKAFLKEQRELGALKTTSKGSVKSVDSEDAKEAANTTKKAA